MKAWLLTNPYPQPHWHETRRMLYEMEKRGLKSKHIRPCDWTIVNNQMFIDNQLVEAPDLIINRHALAWPGPPNDYEKLSQAKMLESSGTFIVNKIDSQIEALSKITAHKKYVKANIPTPKTAIIDLLSDDAFDRINDEIGWPCVVKWPFSCFGSKVILCKTRDDIILAMKEELQSNPINMEVLVQEYLNLNYMMAAHVVKGRNIESQMQFIAPNTTEKFKANIAKGNYRLPTKTTNEMSDLVTAALDALDLEWARIDIFPTKEGLKICEVNPSGNMPWNELATLNNLAGHMVQHALDKMMSR